MSDRRAFRARSRYAQGLGYGTKLAFFLGAICVEKVTLVGEILPVGIVLPALSPVLFGGVAQARAQFDGAQIILRRATRRNF